MPVPNILVAQVVSELTKVASVNATLTTNSGIPAPAVKLKVCAVESTVPSFTLAVMVTVPDQSVAGVSVRLAPETLTVTSPVEEVAE